MRVWGSTAACAATAFVAPVTVAVLVGLGTFAGLGSLGRAYAQPSDVVVTATTEEPSAPPVGYGAMPGGLHVASAETLPPGTVEAMALGGFGYRKGLLHADHVFSRALGDLAVTYAPIANLAFGVSFDGRYDKHSGGSIKDDAYVGDPHLLVRYASPVGASRKIALGGQLGVWAPGKDAPSLVASAISVDGRALLSVDLGFGTLSANAGFRLDNSAKSADGATSLSAEDQVSLGVSDFSAALFGASLRIPAGRRAYVAFEGSADVFVGEKTVVSDKAPDLILKAPGPIIRGTAMAGIMLGDAFTLIGFIEAAKVPGVEYFQVPGTEMMAVKLVPYEPTITGGIGLQARFGGPSRTPNTAVVTPTSEKVPIPVPVIAEISGAVFDDAGKPVVGAKVTVKLRDNVGTTVTDGKGTYTVGKLPIGKTLDGKTELDDTAAEIQVEVASKKPGGTTVTLDKGVNTVPPITLDPLLPPGQLRGGVINAGNGRPIAGATVTIDPGDVTATSGPDGKFTVDLPPGRYKITVTARGLAQQQLDVIIEQNGVAIKNIELHK